MKKEIKASNKATENRINTNPNKILYCLSNFQGNLSSGLVTFLSDVSVFFAILN